MQVPNRGLSTNYKQLYIHVGSIILYLEAPMKKRDETISGGLFRRCIVQAARALSDGWDRRAQQVRPGFWRFPTPDFHGAECGGRQCARRAACRHELPDAPQPWQHTSTAPATSHRVFAAQLSNEGGALPNSLLRTHEIDVPRTRCRRLRARAQADDDTTRAASPLLPRDAPAALSLRYLRTPRTKGPTADTLR
jgi:hypothetical protein